MKKFKIYFTYDGHGEAIIEAKNENEARDKFWDGEYFEELDCPNGRENIEIDETIKYEKTNN